MTRYFAVVFAEHPAPAPSPHQWRAWIKMEPADPVAVGLVLNRSVRDYGGVHERLPVTVYETLPMGATPEEAKSATFNSFTLHPA